MIVFIALFEQVNTAHFEQENTGWVQNIYVSSWLKSSYKQKKQTNKQTTTKKKQKGVTLYEVKHQKNFDDVLVLYSLSLNFEYLLFATLSMCFANWFNFANVKTIVIVLIETGNRNSKE